MKLLSLVGIVVMVGIGKPGCAADTAPTAAPGSPQATETNSLTGLGKIEALDDAAQAEVERLMRENDTLKAKGAEVSESEMEKRIAARMEPVRKAYEEYLTAHPADARAHLLYGGFLNDRQDEPGAQVQWEKALELDPTNAAVYNNLAGRYIETGPVKKVFEYFTKAIELGPNDAVYYHNFGDGLYVLRSRAATYYGINEQQVYGKVLLMYSNAMRLAPTNYTFARDLAQTFYSIKPFKAIEALGAWTNALGAAHDEIDREDVYVHLARVKMLAGHYAEARAQLRAVTNEASLKAKTNLLHNIAEREKAKP